MWLDKDMNASTARKSVGHHRRYIDTAFTSARMADQVLRVLLAAGNADPTLYGNSYFLDTIRQAQERSNEMHDDIDACIEAAVEDGFDINDVNEFE